MSCVVGPVAGDLDGDSRPEIIVMVGGANPAGYYILEADGSDWSDSTVDIAVPPKPGAGNLGTTEPAIADFDKDGTAEIVVVHSSGDVYILPHTGGSTTVFEYKSDQPTDTPGGSPRIADVDENGSAEVIIGNDVFEIQGTNLV
ncbi:MAG: hypothetical protein GKR87_11690 [Kiritimatiellae bacterium]|nr:hypothetical protein [Kiritimatiellia bacterium]